MRRCPNHERSRTMETTLGKKYTITNEDGFALLHRLADGSVDHIITDPPYSEQTHTGARTHGGDADQRGNALIDFTHFTDEQFIEFCTQAVRVARRWVVATCDWKHAALIKASTDLPIIRVGIWLKRNGAPQFTGDRPGMGYETILIMHRPGAMRWNGGGKHGVWDFPTITNGTVQKTQKPLALLRALVADFTDVGDLICDPFGGSFTSGVAALELDRFFIGCEIDADRFAKGAKRMEQQASRLSLFDLPPENVGAARNGKLDL